MKIQYHTKLPSMIVTFVMLVVVFTVDLFVPLGVAAGVPYVWVLLSSHWSPGRRITITLAVICTILTYFGFLWSPSGGVLWMVVANRLLALAAIWITAWLCLRRKKNEILLTNTSRELGRQTDILTSVLNSIREGVLVTDPNGGLLVLNPSARELLGLQGPVAIDSEGLLSRLRPPMNLQPDELGESPLDRVYAGKTIKDLELELPGERAEEGRYVLVNGAPLGVGSSGEPTPRGGVFTLRDITQQKKIQESIVHAIEEEQRRIGQDLHDGLIQQLVGIQLMHETLESSERRTDDASGELARSITHRLKDSVTMARKLSRTMFPVELEDNGLIHVLENLAQHVSSLFTVECRFLKEIEVGAPGRFGVQVGTHLYRIAQEALTNAAKHAGAGRIDLIYRETAELAEIQVVDDGDGFERARIASGGIGLDSMTYRAKLIGAQLSIESETGTGTTVHCKLIKQSDSREFQTEAAI